MSKPKSVLILSGGLDSTVLLYDLLAKGESEVSCLTFDYGQRHRKEIQAAFDTCYTAHVPRRLADISALRPLISRSALHSGMVPEGHYSEESMKATVSPNRNMIFLSVAVAHAITIGAATVYYAAHAGDHAIYPDCRPEFVVALKSAVHEGNAWSPVDIDAPFIHLSKAEIVLKGADLRVPFRLTWSCYKGKEVACGRCGTCVERLEAFDLAGVEDPLQYQDREFWKQAVKEREVTNVNPT